MMNIRQTQRLLMVAVILIVLVPLTGVCKAPEENTDAGETAEPEASAPDGSMAVPILGFAIAPAAELITPPEEGDTLGVHGFVVLHVDESGTASLFGIPEGSRIISAVAGERMLAVGEGALADELVDLCKSAEPGEILRLEVQWDDAVREIRLLVPGGKLKEGPRLGIQLGYIPKRTDGTVPPGVLVASVFEASVAEHVGVKPNDVILAWNGTIVNDPVELQKAVLRTGAGDMVAVILLRSGEELRMGFTMP